jgi:hypothetical protein
MDCIRETSITRDNVNVKMFALHRHFVAVSDKSRFRITGRMAAMVNDSDKNKPKKMNPSRRWEVFSSDRGYWRTGLYRPEATSPADITEFEKHSCPELFICLGGRAGLVVSDGGKETMVEFGPGEELLVTDYHNGFQIDPGAYFLVVERTEFSTEYMDRLTGKSIRRVEVE